MSENDDQALLNKYYFWRLHFAKNRFEYEIQVVAERMWRVAYHRIDELANKRTAIFACFRVQHVTYHHHDQMQGRYVLRFQTDYLITWLGYIGA